MPGFISGIGGGEILIIFLIVLLLFGPKKLPDFAKTIARTMAKLRSGVDEIKREIGLDEDFLDDTTYYSTGSKYVAKPPQKSKLIDSVQKGIQQKDNSCARDYPPKDRPTNETNTAKPVQHDDSSVDDPSCKAQQPEDSKSRK